MEKLINTIVIASATLSAFILYLVGIRKLEANKNKKYGLFMTTLLIVLGLTVNDAVSHSIPKTDVSIKTSIVGKRESYRISRLRRTQEWKKFKKFWKNLDQISPKKKVDSTKPINYGEYFGSIKIDKAKSLRKELTELVEGLKKLEKKKKMKSIEIKLLRRVCQERIMYMSTGFTSMVVRMMPPPVLLDKEKTIMSLERSIDTLIKLRKNKKISKKTFKQAITNIQKDINAFSILDILYNSYGQFYGYVDFKGINPRDNIKKYIEAFEKHYSDFQTKKKQGKVKEKYYKNIEAKYKKSKKEIEEIKKISPSFNLLVVDLEK